MNQCILLNDSLRSNYFGKEYSNTFIMWGSQQDCRCVEMDPLCSHACIRKGGFTYFITLERMKPCILCQ